MSTKSFQLLLVQALINLLSRGFTDLARCDASHANDVCAGRWCHIAPMDVHRIFAPEQISVHPELPSLLKEYSKAIIRANPADALTWSLEYFRQRVEGAPNQGTLDCRNTVYSTDPHPRMAACGAESSGASDGST
jgi:hypothetical protein